MVTLHSELEGTVNVYTMDHRGTGRSTLLDCVAAQVTTTGSPWGNEIDPTEVPACAEDLQTKYGDLASFSVTTAATDLATFISRFTNGAGTIVYGVSYGTMFAERLIHLAPLQVTGYVLDGIATTSGAPADEFFYMSKWAYNFGEVGDVFLSLCESDSDCKFRFDSNGLNNTLQGVIEQFDHDPNSTCASLVNSTVQLGESPSFSLRFALGSALMDSYARTLIPPVVYRLARCAPEDIDVLTQFFTTVEANKNAKTQGSAFESTLLYSLIVFSEMTESPLPSMSELRGRYAGVKMSTDFYLLGPLYCAYTKEKSASCEEINVGTYESNGIVYKHDQYWNKTATIPNQASVLLLSGKLDPQTPNKYAEYLLNELQGEKKELIAFEYATHDTVMTTQMVAGDPWSEACGMKVLASYVRGGGNLELLDRSCVDDMPAFNLTTPDFYLYSYFGTDDAYDGVYNSSLMYS
ncbi:hypothetical protein PI126_g13653 [Phytophthora idaei]|nr:hypothetical protein PI126_g13653 [Phytophthora idaei]